MRRRIWLLATVLLALANSTPAATTGSGDDTQVLARGLALRDAYSAQAQAQIDALSAAAQSGDQIALLTLVRAASTSAALTPAARERILYESALMLAQLSPLAPAAREWLADTTTYRSQARVWQEDAGHRSAVAMYEVAAAARFALRRASVNELAAEYSATIAAGTFDPAQIVAHDPATRTLHADAARAAFAGSSLEQLTAHAGGLARVTGLDRDFDRCVAEVVARSGDAALATTLMEKGTAAVVLRSFAQLAELFGDAQALRLLRTAAAREDLRSAALYQAAELSARLPAASAWLFERLDDPQDSRLAGAALASRHDADTARRLHDWLLNQSGAAAQRRGLLALRLDGSASAREQLARLAQDDRLAPALRQEVAQWQTQ